ncbi:MAG: response regulator [Magnetococcales bacterium]|nr:response regulator [Magnetococcales bacterium]
MGEPDRILVVEDDEETRNLLRTYLEKNGFDCRTLPDGSRLHAELEREETDMVILDLMLPGDDGLTLCRNLRADPRTANLPVIMLTARVEETDRIVGLEMGADDYIPKPFNPRELLARIKSVMRRARADPVGKPEALARRMRFSGWTLDLATRQLKSPEEVVVPLSKKEYDLLRIFLTHARQVLDRDRIMELYAGRGSSPFERGIDVQIGRLRKRLREDSKDPVIIRTVRGHGYMLDSDVDMLS